MNESQLLWIEENHDKLVREFIDNNIELFDSFCQSKYENMGELKNDKEM